MREITVEQVERELEELRQYQWGMPDNPNKNEEDFFKIRVANAEICDRMMV